MRAQGLFEGTPAFLFDPAQPRCRYLPETAARKNVLERNGSSLQRISLGGEWAFLLFEGQCSLPDNIVTPEYALSRCPKTTVPSFFGEPSDVFPAPFFPPEIPPFVRTGVYIRDIELGRVAPGGKKYIVFEGVAGRFYVFVNGNPVGIGSDRGLCEFEIGRFLTDGKNRIAVAVESIDGASYFDRPDMFSRAGIFRPVYLLFRPNGHVGDINIRCNIPDDFKTADLAVSIATDCPESAEARLFDPDGAEIARRRFDENGNAVFTVESPRFWNTESPVQYTVEISCCGEYIYRPASFRKAEFENGKLRLNGRHVMLSGTVYSPSADLSASELKKDVVKMKRSHLNSVIYCGTDDTFLSLCDRYGLMAICLADVSNASFDAAGNSSYLNDTSLFPIIKRRIVPQLAVLSGHTSVVGWCLDGFCGNGRNVHDAIEIIKNSTPSPVFYAGAPSDFAGVARFEQRPDGFLTPDPMILSDPMLSKRPLILRSKEPTVAFGENGRFAGCFSSFSERMLCLVSSMLLPVRVEEIDASAGDFYITNLFDFSYLSNLECYYEITSRGRVVSDGFAGVYPLPPGRCERIHVDYDLPDGDENFVRLIFRRLGSCRWAPDGFEEGFVQFALPSSLPDGEPADEKPVKASRLCDRITFSGKNFEYEFSLVDGEMTVGADRIGFDDFSGTAVDFVTARLSAELSQDGNAAVLRCERTLAPKGSGTSVDTVSVWCVMPDGKITLDCSVRSDVMLDGFGICFDRISDAEYFGLGPIDNRPGEAFGCYNGIFGVEDRADRIVRSVIFKRKDRNLCVFCPDRMRMRLHSGRAVMGTPEKGSVLELSLGLCPTDGSEFKFE